MTEIEMSTLARFEAINARSAKDKSLPTVRAMLAQSYAAYEDLHGRKPEVVQIPEDWVAPLRVILDVDDFMRGDEPTLFGIPAHVVPSGGSFRWVGLKEQEHADI